MNLSGEGNLQSPSRPWFEPLVRELEDNALGFAMTLTHDRDLAEEILQEAFARVWASTNTPGEKSEFKRWLYRAILNLARDHSRRQRRWAALRFWAPPPPDPLLEIERRADDAALLSALRTLGTREAAAVHLRYFEDRSFSEIGEILRVSEGHARVMVHRALAKLRQTLGGDLAVQGVEA